MRPHIDISPQEQEQEQRRRRQFRIRSLMLLVAVVAVWLLAFRTPGVRELVLGFFLLLGLGLGVGLVAMALSLVGFGLFAAWDRLVAWFRFRGDPE